MFCEKCGKELKEDDKFCPYCGNPVPQNRSTIASFDGYSDEDMYAKSKDTSKKATFSEGVKALFTKIFVFDGKSSRSEFNYGLLFLFLISLVIGFACSFPMVVGMIKLTENFFASVDPSSEEALNDFVKSIEEYSYTYLVNPWSSVNVGAYVNLLIYLIFLPAPIFRRTMDVYGKKGLAITFVIFFLLGELLNSSLTSLLIPAASLRYFDALFSVASLLSFVVLFICVFIKPRKN